MPENEGTGSGAVQGEGRPARPLDPLELLRLALAIPSISGNERRLAEFLVASSTGLGEAFVDESGSTVIRVGSGPLRVTFLGHIDTVPGAVEVREEGGRLYGRGAVDAKGPFCAALAAASGLSDRALSRMTLTLIGATEEEAPSSKGARHALVAYPAPHLLLIGEPSGWEAMTLGYKGRLLLEAMVAKGSHHSAGSESTAGEDGVEVWNHIAAWAAESNRGREGIFDQVQVALQSIATEEDGLEQRCRLLVGLRLPPWLPPDLASESLRPLLPSGHRYEFRNSEEPYRGPKDTPLTRAFRTSIREQGGTPRFKLKTGTSDMNVVAPTWRVPMLAYGPGDSSLDHTPSEHVEIAELRKATEVLARAFELLAELTPEGLVDQSPESS